MKLAIMAFRSRKLIIKPLGRPAALTNCHLSHVWFRLYHNAEFCLQRACVIQSYRMWTFIL